MTVKELIRELQSVPEDAIVTYYPETADKPYIVDGVNYNDATNTIVFYGGDIFGFEESNSCNGDCMKCHEPCQMNQDIPDESNYNPLWRLRYARMPRCGN